MNTSTACASLQRICKGDRWPRSTYNRPPPVLMLNELERPKPAMLMSCFSISRFTSVQCRRICTLRQTKNNKWLLFLVFGVLLPSIWFAPGVFLKLPAQTRAARPRLVAN